MRKMLFVLIAVSFAHHLIEAKASAAECMSALPEGYDAAKFEALRERMRSHEIDQSVPGTLDGLLKMIFYEEETSKSPLVHIMAGYAFSQADLHVLAVTHFELASFWLNDVDYCDSRVLHQMSQIGRANATTHLVSDQKFAGYFSNEVGHKTYSTTGFLVHQYDFALCLVFKAPLGKLFDEFAPVLHYRTPECRDRDAKPR